MASAGGMDSREPGAAGDPAALVGPMRREMSQMHPLVPLAKAAPLDETVSAWLAPGWFMLLLLASCAGLAVVLAAVGIYAVMSYTIAERTREIGVRIALGTRPFDIVALILRQGGLVAAIGLPAGLTLSLIFGRLLQALLYGITPHDPVTLVGSSVSGRCSTCGHARTDAQSDRARPHNRNTVRMTLGVSRMDRLSGAGGPKRRCDILPANLSDFNSGVVARFVGGCILAFGNSQPSRLVRRNRDAVNPDGPGLYRKLG